MHYDQEDNTKALEVLKDLATKNEKLEGDLLTFKRFLLAMFMSGDVFKSETSIYFFNSFHHYEDLDFLAKRIFINPNLNNSCNSVDEKYMSSISFQIPNGTPFPSNSTLDEIMILYNKIVKETV